MGAGGGGREAQISATSIARKDARRSAPCGRREARWCQERVQRPLGGGKVGQTRLKTDVGRRHGEGMAMEHDEEMEACADLARMHGTSWMAKARLRCGKVDGKDMAWKRGGRTKCKGMATDGWTDDDAWIGTPLANAPRRNARRVRANSVWNGAQAFQCESNGVGRMLSAENARWARRWLASSADRTWRVQRTKERRTSW